MGSKRYSVAQLVAFAPKQEQMNPRKAKTGREDPYPLLPSNVISGQIKYCLDTLYLTV